MHPYLQSHYSLWKKKNVLPSMAHIIPASHGCCTSSTKRTFFFLFYFLLLSLVNEHSNNSSSSPSRAYSAFLNLYNGRSSAPDSLYLYALFDCSGSKFHQVFCFYILFSYHFLLFYFILKASPIVRFVAKLSTSPASLFVLLIICTQLFFFFAFFLLLIFSYL